MFIVLEGVLTATEAGAIRQAAETLGFGPGSETAGRHARQVKANDQARSSPELEAIQAAIRDASGSRATTRPLPLLRSA